MNLSVGTDVISKRATIWGGNAAPIWQDMARAALAVCFHFRDHRPNKGLQAQAWMAWSQDVPASKEHGFRPQTACELSSRELAQLKGAQGSSSQLLGWGPKMGLIHGVIFAPVHRDEGHDNRMRYFNR
jgi:hypothetical protein